MRVNRAGVDFRPHDVSGVAKRKSEVRRDKVKRAKSLASAKTADPVRDRYPSGLPRRSSSREFGRAKSACEGGRVTREENE